MNTSTQTPANTTRTEVLRLAWQMVKTSGLSLASALKQAWAAIKLKGEMMLKPVSFFYTKNDGSQRFAVGHYPVTSPVTGNAKATGPLVIRYYDTLAQGWRSFRADRLIVA